MATEEGTSGSGTNREGGRSASEPSSAAQRPVLGLLGGVASGKSTVAALLAERGLLVLDADALAREVATQPEILAALARRFGPGVLDAAGRLDRPALARAAFADEQATADLNALVHPEVRRRLLAALAAEPDRPVVLDVPLLLESPLAGRVTCWIFIDSSAGDRDERAAGRNWPEGERARREKRQADLAVKRSHADEVLENHGDIGDLEAEVDALLDRLGVT